MIATSSQSFSTVSSTWLERNTADPRAFAAACARAGLRAVVPECGGTLTFEGGDLVTRTLPWAGSVRLGGFQISRDFSVRPDIVTYPLPTFSGSAAVPSSVDLFVNGNHATSGSVDPGPFTLGDVPYVNGAGEAVVVTTDAQGRRVATSTQFYVANTLLRRGLDELGFIEWMS